MAITRTRINFIAALAMFGCCFHALADFGDKVQFPTDYRKWTHVKSTLIGPQHQSFANNGGIHHFYANEKAMEGYRSGKFPDGAVLIDDLLEITEKDGVTSEGPHRRIAVMVKDSQRYRDTGGWGFEIFKGDPAEGVLSVAAKADCFACHQKASELVFSKFRK